MALKMSKEKMKELILEILHLTFACEPDDEIEEAHWNPNKELDSDTLGELVNLLHEFGLCPPRELPLGDWP